MAILAVLLLVLASFDGCGRGLARLLTRAALPAGLAPALGFALFIAVFGPIELFHVAGPAAFSAFLAAGVALESVLLAPGAARALRVVRSRQPSGTIAGALPSASSVLLAAVAAATAVLLVLRWTYAEASLLDDYQGYLVLPERILQQGWLGNDVFNLRRVEMGLGGGSYVQALFLTFLDLSRIRGIDAAVGLSLFGLVLLGRAGENRLSSLKRALLLAVAAFFVALAPLLNSSAHLTAGALFCAYLVLAFRRGGRVPDGTAFVTGLLLGAAAILKAQFLIPAVLFPASIYGYRLLIERDRRAWREAVLVAGSALVVMLPWMLASYRSIGTPLFPFLGTGASQSGALTQSLSAGEIAVMILHNGALLGVAVGMAAVIRRRSPDRWLATVAIIAAVDLVAFTLLFNLTLSAGTFRYLYSFVVLPIIVLFGEFLAVLGPGYARTLARTPLAQAAAAAFAVFAVQMLRGRDTDLNLTRVVLSLPADVAGHLRTPDIDNNDPALSTPLFLRSPTFRAHARALAAMQAAVPPGTPLAAAIDLPFVLDFARQPVFVMDCPGSAGPGTFPFARAPEELAVYLRQNGIRYLAFSAFNEALHPTSHFAGKLAEHESYWISNVARRTLAVQAQIVALKDHYPRVFDDGQSFVLDIGGNAQVSER